MNLDKERRQLSEFFKEFRQQLPRIFSFSKKDALDDLITIDIGSRFLKILKVTKAGLKYTVDFFAYLPIPNSTIVQGEIKNFSILANLIYDVLTKNNIETKNLAFSMPRASTIIKNITVDSRLNSDEIESRVWIEVNKLFPNLVGDIYLDYSVVGLSPKDATQLDLLLVACRKDQLDPFLYMFRSIDLIPRVIDINSYALERALAIIAKQAPDKKTISLLNIGFSLIDLIVVSEGQLVYMHELSYDGSGMLNQIQCVESASIKEHKVLDMATADETESTSNFSEEDAPNLTSNVEVFKNNLGTHLRHAMQFFYSSRPNIRIDRIYLSGDCVVTLPALLDYVQQEIGKEVMLTNPFENIILSANVDKEALQQCASSFVLCCGLAMSKLN